MLASAAAAALMGLSVPAGAATSPSLDMTSQIAAVGKYAGALDRFYAARNGQPLWFAGDAASAAKLVSILERSEVEGLGEGPTIAARARALYAAGQVEQADRLLSAGFMAYADMVQSPPPGVTYGDSWVTPKRLDPAALLSGAGAAADAGAYAAKISSINPIYDGLRSAAFDTYRSSGERVDARVVASLERARFAPKQHRYVMVDAAAGNLWMIEDGQIVGAMPVVTGKAEFATPMIASTIYYATLNPYWNVPGDLAREMIAPRVVSQGIEYLTIRNYDVLDGYGPGANLLDPASVDWKAVADGRETVKLRRRPDAANSMGKMKFAFPNQSDIYLHDTPDKSVFDGEDRNLSHGCIRLSDAKRLGAWLLGHDPAKDGDAPEQHVQLKDPVPIFITYLTARNESGRLAFADDPYGKDQSESSVQVAALR